MKTFNHVNDIWEALETCETATQIYDILDNIPTKFGTWWADVVGEGELEVTNQWWDTNQEDMMTESQTFEVDLESDNVEENDRPLEESKWYRISFSAKLTPSDLRAMNKCFFDAMNEAMEIYDLANLVIEEA
jgi:hypothetical protein